MQSFMFKQDSSMTTTMALFSLETAFSCMNLMNNNNSLMMD